MNLREDCPAEEKTMRHLHCMASIATVLFIPLLFWALWLKFNIPFFVRMGYSHLCELTLKERFLFNIIPFYVWQNFLWQWSEILANGLVFAPFGVLLNHAFAKKNIWRDLAICFCVSLAIEITQLFTIIGNFASVDLVMNTVGYFIGFAAYRWIFEKLSLRKTVCFYRIVVVVATLILIFAIFNTIKNRELLIAILTRTL